MKEKYIREIFGRFKELIDDWNQFQNALLTPPPPVFWSNPLKIETDKLIKLMNDEGLNPQPLTWTNGAYRLPPGTPIGGTWWYLSGLLHIQEEASLLPPHLLKLSPGARVLDLCAAPGNKTAQIAVKLKNTGTIVANDVNKKRLRALRRNIHRLGIINTAITNWDAANYPLSSGPFDAVIADVPCSGLGVFRKQSRTSPKWFSPQYSREQHKVQRAILTKAILLCKPGGTIVYSTCTLAPEENESVINAVLSEFSNCLELIPISVEGLSISPGITRWEGENFSETLKYTARLWPHRVNSSGFFVALIKKSARAKALKSWSFPPKKTDETIANTPTSKEVSLSFPTEKTENLTNKSKNPEERQQNIGDKLPHPPEKTSSPHSNTEIPAPAHNSETPAPPLKDIIEHFQLPPELFLHFKLKKKSSRLWNLIPKDWKIPEKPPVTEQGLPLIKNNGKYIKITSTGAITFGRWAKNFRLELNQNQLQKYLLRQNIELTKEQIEKMPRKSGIVIVFHRDIPLGTGLWIWRGPNRWQFENQFPKVWSLDYLKKPDNTNH